jgi:hypothetical protein
MVKHPKRMSSLTGLIAVGAVEEVTVVKQAFAVEKRVTKGQAYPNAQTIP